MFKVECLGCQAPYQVDERRVPEKGLKMRCPKCGTSFKVEPPEQSLPQAEGATVADAAAVTVPTPRPFTSANADPTRRLDRPPGSSRDPMARTMIGVSASDLELAMRLGDPAKRKPFRVPRPTDVPATAPRPVAEAAGASEEPAQVALPAAASSLYLGSVTALPAEIEQAELPMIVGDFAGAAPPVAAARPTDESVPEAEWIAAEEAPQSLPDPSSPLSLSELPAPVVATTQSRQPEPLAPDTETGAGIELDFGDDLPVAAMPGRNPPRRRPRVPPPPRAAKGQPEEDVDLPARLEDLEAGLPRLAMPRPTPPKPTPPKAPQGKPTVPAFVPPSTARRPLDRPRQSSLDELDLPAIAARQSAEPPAPAERSRARNSHETAADLPSVTRAGAVSRQLSDADLPAVGRAAPAPNQRRPSPVDDLPDVLSGGFVDRAAGLPTVPGSSDLPEVFSAGWSDATDTGLPEALGSGLPEVLGGSGLPEVLGSGLPEILGSDLPDVLNAGLPDVSGMGLPEVLAVGLPDMPSAGLPEVLASGLPTLSETGLPEITGRGVARFGRVDLPVAREAGLPEVRGMGGLEMDLPGVGEALPSLVDGSVFDGVNLPLVGGVLPMAKSRGGAQGHNARGAANADDDADPFGAFNPETEADPFAGSEAEFGMAPDEDPFGSGADDPTGLPDGHGSDGQQGRGAFGSEEGADFLGAGYGEVDIAEEGAEGRLETADDMEFRAIPQHSSAPPGRAAASASVHVDAVDADAAGATLELAPNRQAFPRARARRLAMVAALCLSTVAGGALALKPALGPFGIHFILDQVHRGEHERLLGKLAVDGRISTARDTLAAAEEAIAQVERAHDQAPRFDPIQARLAFVQYAASLRFGPLPKLEAGAKTALDRLEPDSNAPSSRLARAARSAVMRAPSARAELEALGNDPDARELLGQLAIIGADWGAAHEIWSSLAQAAPDSAAATFGLARAALGLGNPQEAMDRCKRVLELNPGHVGARISMLEAQRALQSPSLGAAPALADTDTLVAEIVRVLPQASPGEAALAQSVLGELHLSQGRSGPAQQAFEESLAIDRNFPRALVGLGETLHRAGRYTEALARFEAAARAEPASLHAQLGIAKSQIQLAHLAEAKAALAQLLEKYATNPEVIYWSAKGEQAAGANDAALLAYRASIEAGKGRADSVDAYLALAKLQAELGQLVLAQQTLSEARSKLPASGPLYNALGEIAMTRAEYSEAYAQFQAALQLDSGDTRARFLGAIALTRLGRFDEALAAFQSVGEKDKDFPGLAIERGRLFEESGRNVEALKEYEAAFVKAPDDPDVQIRVGCARVACGHIADAENLLEKALKAKPRSAEAYYCLGRTLFAQERYVDSINRLERAVSLDASRAIYHLYVGWVANEVGRHGQAETALDEAIELDKGLADAYWQRGRLRLKQGAVKDAIVDLERALGLKPSRNEAVADLALAYADLGRMPKALATWEAALARDPDNATWHFRYGKLLSSTGSGPLAAAHLKRALDLAAEAQSAPPGNAGEKPVWLWQAQYLLAHEFGEVAAAIPHWQAYMRLSPPDDPYRREAERALIALGQPWDAR